MVTIPEELTTQVALRKWLLEFHATSKTLDAQAFSMFFTKDAELHFANNPTAHGREAIQQSFAFAFEKLESMTHEIVYFDSVPGSSGQRIYQAADIRYVVKGDDPEKDEIRVPGMMSGLFTIEDGKLKLENCEVYLDMSKVLARMAEKGLLG